MKFRPEADVWPLVSDDELRKLAADIDENGQLHAIELYEGDILDGRNRYMAITRFCVKVKKPWFVTVTPESPIRRVVSLNEKRRHLNESQRAWAAQKALPFFEAEAKKRMSEGGQNKGGPIGPALPPRRATADAADAFGTSDGSVKRAKRVEQNASLKLAEAIERGNLSLGKAEQITRLYPDKNKQDAVVRDIAKSQMTSRVKGLTGEVEWYTPRLYLDAAVKVMGNIDLDPASSDLAQEHVRARKHYTIEDDGLSQTWHGAVFLNPPYAMPAIRDFVLKMTDSWQQGHITHGILLTNNATDTEWFHHALKSARAVCLTRGRIHFLEGRNGDLVEKNSPTHGQAFFYFGPDPERFTDVFSEFGSIVVPATRELMRHWAAKAFASAYADTE